MSRPTADLAAAPHLEAGGPRVSLWALTRYFLLLGTVGFGGPVALVERMRRDLHEARGWVTEAEYNEGLALAQLAPGPLAAQLAIYLGWLRAGTLGATLIGVAFVVPSFAMVLALSATYVRFGGLPWMQGAFYGIGAAVIALIASSAWRLVRRTARADRLLWAVVAVNGLATAIFEREILWLLAASGLAVLAIRARPRAATAMSVAIPAWLMAAVPASPPLSQLATILLFFAKAGAVVFGSGLAIVPFLHGTTVLQLHWLTEQQFLDAVAVSMITPGPVVITVAFIGYLLAGPLGATAAAVGVFLPVYLITVLLAPWFRLVARNAQLHAAVAGVTAGATGAIAGAAFVLGRRALVDPVTWALFAVALIVLLRVRKIPEPLLIATAGVVGIFLHRATG